jgi:hypothetical protein
MESDEVGDCLRVKRMYEGMLKVGPYPTSEVRVMGLTDSESANLSMYLADVAGIASHGVKLLALEASRRKKFQQVVAESFATKWPQINQRISASETPKMYRLMIVTEDARLLIKRVLGEV